MRVHHELLKVASTALLVAAGAGSEALCAVPWVGDCDAPGFAPLTLYLIGSPPTDVAVADFDEDGHADFAVAFGGVVLPPAPSAISVSLNAGDGTFLPAVQFPTGTPSEQLVAADFNGDAHLDLFVSPAQSLSGVLLGNGDGTFQPLLQNGLVNALDLAVGDFNDDGKRDCAAAAGFGFESVEMLLGNGDGTFGPVVQVPAGGMQNAIVVGDWNFDGWSDMAVTRRLDNVVAVILNAGDGTFLDPVDYPTGREPVHLATGPLDSIPTFPVLPDARPDLVVVNFGQNTVSLLLGNGDGTFNVGSAFATGAGPDAVTVGDFWPRDGRYDLAVVNRQAGTLSVLLGHGDGTFQPKVDVSTGGALPGAIGVGDFDADGPLDPGLAGFHGYSDLVVANGASGTVGVLLGDCRPIALCTDVVVPADGNCTASASIDAGSFDPDPGDVVTLAQSPAGPYALGPTNVTLSVTDAAGASSQCAAVVTVVDVTAPAITCPAAITVPTDPGKCTAKVVFEPVVSDNCPIQLVCVPASGTAFPIGTTAVTCTATDPSALSATCTFNVTVTVGNRCPQGFGYWKTHTELWPAVAVPMEIGGKSYRKPELVALMKSPTAGDASKLLPKQLIAAILNTANGSDPQPICDTIGEAQALLGSFAQYLPLEIGTSSAEGKQMVALASKLEAYNDGALTPDCDP